MIIVMYITVFIGLLIFIFFELFIKKNVRYFSDKYGVNPLKIKKHIKETTDLNFKAEFDSYKKKGKKYLLIWIAYCLIALIAILIAGLIEHL